MKRPAHVAQLLAVLALAQGWCGVAQAALHDRGSESFLDWSGMSCGSGIDGLGTIACSLNSALAALLAGAAWLSARHRRQQGA